MSDKNRKCILFPNRNHIENIKCTNVHLKKALQFMENVVTENDIEHHVEYITNFINCSLGFVYLF